MEGSVNDAERHSGLLSGTTLSSKPTRPLTELTQKDWELNGQTRRQIPKNRDYWDKTDDSLQVRGSRMMQKEVLPCQANLNECESTLSPL
jgi:hypothetical protein